MGKHCNPRRFAPKDVGARRNRRVDSKLEHEWLAEAWKTRDEFVRIRMLPDALSQRVFVVNQIEHSLRIVAKRGFASQELLDGHAIAAHPARFLIVERLIEQPLNLGRSSALFW